MGWSWGDPVIRKMGIPSHIWFVCDYTPLPEAPQPSEQEITSQRADIPLWGSAHYAFQIETWNIPQALVEIKLLYVGKDECKTLAAVNHPTQGKLLWSESSLARESRGLIYLQRKHSPEMSGCLPAHTGPTTNMAERHEVWQESLDVLLVLRGCRPMPTGTCSSESFPLWSSEQFLQTP